MNKFLQNVITKIHKWSYRLWVATIIYSPFYETEAEETEDYLLGKHIWDANLLEDEE